MLIQIKPAPLLLLYHRMYHILPDEETSRAACRVKKSQLLLLPSHHEFPFCCRPSACGCFNRSVIVGFGSSFNREKANFFFLWRKSENECGHAVEWMSCLILQMFKRYVGIGTNEDSTFQLHILASSCSVFFLACACKQRSK